MDDLEHSVHISEQDWYTFYEESEECCIQQARLAGLDDSGLSDTDEEKKSTHSGIPFQPVLPLQTNPGNSIEEHGAAAQTLCETDVCEEGNSVEASECVCIMTDLTDKQNAQILTSDSSVIELHSDSLQNSASHKENFKEQDQSQGEDTLDQVINEPITITPSLCIQDMEHAASSEAETATKVMESSATPNKEKERWFVTVNDSPVMNTGIAGQKKRRKKKSSRKLAQQSRELGGRCLRSNNEKEAEGEEMKEPQNTVNQVTISKCLDLNTLPDSVCEQEISGSTNIQEVVMLPVKQSGQDCEKSFALKTSHALAAQLSSSESCRSCPFSFKFKGTEDVPLQNPEKNPSASLNSKSLCMLMQSSHLQAYCQSSFMTQLANEESTIRDMANQVKSYRDITTQNQPVIDNLSHVQDDPEENSSSLILSTHLTTASDLLHQHHYEEKLPSLQETLNQEPYDESLKDNIGPSRPIYALSSFWDEMERLTINDILHLRVADKRYPLSRDFNPEESNVHLGDINQDSKDCSLQDSSLTDDTADSDYFTHVDDSKPDRSSCEFSTLSDFDEEFQQIINSSANPSPEPQTFIEQTESFLESTYISGPLPDQNIDLTMMNTESESQDIIIPYPQDGTPLYLYPTSEVQSLLHACEAGTNRNPFEIEGIRKTPSPVLSVGDILDDQYLLHFSDSFANDFDAEGPQIRTPDRRKPVSIYSLKTLSLPETYDDFYSDFVVGNLLFPPVQVQTVAVPIFSSSYSVARDLVFPEVEELIESDIEEDNFPIRVMTRFSNQPEISLFTSQRRNWRNILSMRRSKFIGKGSTWCQKFSSWIFPKESQKVTSGISSRAQPMAHLFPKGNKALVPFVEQQKYFQDTASISDRESLLFSIKQADMCLVCIAFASWVLKSSPQSTDMWKTALLANVSAISAIQYLRKYVNKKATEDDPQRLFT